MKREKLLEKLSEMAEHKDLVVSTMGKMLIERIKPPTPSGEILYSLLCLAEKGAFRQ